LVDDLMYNLKVSIKEE